MKTAEEMPELERLTADMDAVGCTVTTSKMCVWIGGNTYAIRDLLKKNGWKWSPKRRQWWMSLDRYCGWHSDATVDPSKDDYTIMGKGADSKPVLIAECSHHDIRKPDPEYFDLDLALGY